MSKKSKSFTAELSSAINPAAAIILGGSRPSPTAKAPKAPKPTAAPVTIEAAAPRESKSRRVQSLLKPSLYDFLVRSAARKGVSVNDRLNSLLEAAKKAEEA